MTQVSIDQKLLQIRFETDLSLKQAAELISVAYTLSKIEKEERFPQINSIKAYADAYEVDYKELQIHYLTERILKMVDGVDYAIDSLEEVVKIKNNNA